MQSSGDDLIYNRGSGGVKKWTASECGSDRMAAGRQRGSCKRRVASAVQKHRSERVDTVEKEYRAGRNPTVLRRNRGGESYRLSGRNWICGGDERCGRRSCSRCISVAGQRNRLRIAGSIISDGDGATFKEGRRRRRLVLNVDCAARADRQTSSASCGGNNKIRCDADRASRKRYGDVAGAGQRNCLRQAGRSGRLITKLDRSRRNQ